MEHVAVLKKQKSKVYLITDNTFVKCLFDQVSALGRKLTIATVQFFNQTQHIQSELFFFFGNYISNKNVSSHIMIQNLVVKTLTIISSFGSIFRY